MKDLQRWMARRRLGRPRPGSFRTHPRGAFAFEEGADLTGRLEARFGDLSRLCCLDLGSGPGDTVLARQILEIPWRRLIQVEAFPPYVRRLSEKTARSPHRDIRAIRIEESFKTLRKGEADLILLIDVLEHFGRGRALNLLVRAERRAARGVVIFSPVGDVPQEALDGNALQRHRSTWQPDDWIWLGYDVEVFEAFHGQLDPPATAAWAIKSVARDPIAGEVGP
jgi:hypothetical protein